MAVVKGTVASGRVSSGGISMNVSVSSEENGILVVVTTQDSNHANMPVTSIVRNSQSFTKIAHYEPAGNVRIEAWYLANPSVGTYLATVNTTGGLGETSAVFYPVAGVDEVNFVDVYNGDSGNGTPSAINLTTTVDDDLIVHGIVSEAAITAVGSGQTSDASLTDQSYENTTASSKAGGTAGAVSMSATLASGQAYAQLAVAIKAAAASVQPTVVDTRKRKRFLYKVYSSTGTFLKTLNDVVDDPRFTMYINSGIGDLTFKLPRKIDNFDEASSIAQNNRVDVVVYDTEAPTGLVVYSGYISKYTPTLNKGKEYIVVTCLGFITQTERFMAEDASGNTTLTYNSYDPTDILKDVLDKFTAAGGTPDYDGSSTADTSTTVSYEFNTYTVKEVLDKVIELAPNGWYYFVDAENIVTFKGKSATADHTFVLGKDVDTLIPEKSVENMVNRIYFTGGDVSGTPLFKKYERASSIANYGLYAKKIVDGSVTNAGTADIIAGAVLDRSDAPEVRTILVIRDSNAGLGGYDIESIKPGDTCKIVGFKTQDTSQWDLAVWDTDKWDYDITEVSSTVQQIMKVSYEPHQVTLEISSRLPNISKRVEDIKRNLDRIYTDQNPSAPTT